MKNVKRIIVNGAQQNFLQKSIPVYVSILLKFVQFKDHQKIHKSWKRFVKNLKRTLSCVPNLLAALCLLFQVSKNRTNHHLLHHRAILNPYWKPKMNSVDRVVFARTVNAHRCMSKRLIATAHQEKMRPVFLRPIPITFVCLVNGVHPITRVQLDLNSKNRGRMVFVLNRNEWGPCCHLNLLVLILIRIVSNVTRNK